MFKRKKISMKTVSMVLCAMVISSSVSFTPVFAVETESQTVVNDAKNVSENSVIEAEDVSARNRWSVSFASLLRKITGNGEISVICNGVADVVEFEDESTVTEFISWILEMFGISDETEDLRLDWVDADGFRTRILTGNDETDADESVDSIRTAAELYALAEEHPDGLTLIVFNQSSEIARFTVTLDDVEDTLVVDLEEDAPELYLVSYDANGGVLSDTVTVLRAKGEVISYIENSVMYEDHTFVGWYDAKEGGNEVTENTVVESDMMVYAHWTDGAGSMDADEVNTDNVGTDDTIDVANTNTNETDTTDTGAADTDTTDTGAADTDTANNDATDTESDNVSETLQKYKLTIVPPTGTTTEVSVNENVQLNILTERLGYDVASFSLKNGTTSERTIAATITMKEIADMVENSDVYIIGYDSNGNGVGSAKVSKTADNTYLVSLSKDTDVGADASSDKGNGENTGKGEGEVENTGKGAGIAEAVQTGDTSILSLYGVLTGLLAVLLGTLVMWKKKLLQQ